MVAVHEQIAALTNEEREIVQALQRTWSEICYDALALGPMRQRAVIEMVPDYVNDRQTAARIHRLSDSQLMRLGKLAFPFKMYSI
jgi:hypothetical protein